MTTFAAETYQNEFLAAGATRVDALVSVSATGTGNTATGRESAELVIIDVSGSMNFPRTKIKSAVAATCEAIDCIRDDVLFGVIAGDDDARLRVPRRGQARARLARPPGRPPRTRCGSSRPTAAPRSASG